MKKDDIQLTDLYRILHGGVPLEFYVELIIRALFVFLVLTFGMKYLGKRLSSQLSRTELAATATLAAATGLVILAPDRGLVPPLIIVAIIILIQRFIHKQGMRNERFEFATEGHLSLLINEGVLQLKAMQAERISKEQLLIELRNNAILHLGQVKRLYLEANGDFTLIEEPSPKAGMAAIPEWDKELLGEWIVPGAKVCSACGSTGDNDTTACTNCGSNEWQDAISSSR